VSRVTGDHMDAVFYDASAFAQTLCGAWKDSKTTKRRMFQGSRGKLCKSKATKSDSHSTPVTVTYRKPNPNCNPKPHLNPNPNPDPNPNP
jgi:hypothetical protein